MKNFFFFLARTFTVVILIILLISLFPLLLVAFILIWIYALLKRLIWGIADLFKKLPYAHEQRTINPSEGAAMSAKRLLRHYAKLYKKKSAKSRWKKAFLKTRQVLRPQYPTLEKEQIDALIIEALPDAINRVADNERKPRLTREAIDIIIASITASLKK
ncbi:MAG: hypothetical protein S4CHLAM102_13950 [Chlamydiia bacterium]|nr:hypothetical protein [Chlamydiia bacterium]